MPVSERIRRVSKIIFELIIESLPCLVVTEFSIVTTQVYDISEVTMILKFDSPITEKVPFVSIIELEPI